MNGTSELPRGQSPKKGRGSNNRRKAVRKLRRLRQRVANRRHEFLPRTSSGLVRRFTLIALEELSIKNLTISAKRSLEQPGRHMRAKAGLNTTRSPPCSDPCPAG